MDVIDTLAGIAPGSPWDAARNRRPQARTHAQASYAALFQPADPGGVSLLERFALAAFVAALHGPGEASTFYGDALAGAGASPALLKAVAAETVSGLAKGPYGRYPAGPLSREDVPGLSFRVSAANSDVLGPRLAAAFEHAHMLVLHPRDASPEAMQALLDAGWSTTDIVTLSQLVSFLSYQVRVAAGLRVLAAVGERP